MARARVHDNGWAEQLRKPVRWQPLPEVTPEQMEAVRLEQRRDAWLQAYGLDDAYQSFVDAEVLALARADVEAHRTGAVQAYTLLVVLRDPGELPGVIWRQRYTAVPVESELPGCVHTVQSSSQKWARVDATSHHVMGQGCVWREGVAL